MLSGIGPRSHLQELDIPLVEDLPVGQNLQDHPLFDGMLFRKNGISYNSTLEELIELYVQHLEPLLSTQKTMLFTNLGQNASQRPLIELSVNVDGGANSLISSLTANISTGTNGYTEEYLEVVAKEVNSTSDGYMFSILLQPKSKGNVTLKSNDPVDYPIIDLNLLGEEEDIEVLYQSMELLMELNKTRTFNESSYTLVALDSPTCTEYEKYSKEWWFCDIKYFTSTVFHPTSTNKMGPAELNTVVNSDLLVHGFQNLRVIDASVIPEPISGHTMAASTMIGEKRAYLIKARYGKL